MNEPSRETQLEAILHGYLQAVDAGQNPDRDELLQRHPDLADHLREFFSDQAKMHRVAQSLHQALVGDVTVGTVEPSRNGTALTRIRYFGDYELLEEVARGGMGIVYRARQVSLNRVVALKMILAGQLASDADVQRFRTEAEAAANLDHPNIVPIYEIGDHEGQQYFSMKLVEKGNLAGKIAEFEDDPRKAAQLLATITAAVHYAHQHGILHRDLKPANILLDGQGQPLVADFGLAKRVEGESELSRSGAIVGTPSYMAPEQAAAQKGLSTAADVYSLGAIFYELLTGRLPLRGETPLETLRMVVEKQPDRPSAVKPGIDRDLETICLKCLEKDPHQRYSSAGTLADDLERWLRDEPITARPVSPAERTWRWCRRNPAPAGLVAAVVVVLLAGSGISTYFAVRATGAEKDAKSERDRAQDAARAARAAENNAKKGRDLAVAAEQRAMAAAEKARTAAAEAKRERDQAKQALLAMFKLGVYFQQGGKWEQALAVYSKALELSKSAGKLAHPEIPAVIFVGVFEFKRQGRYGEAERLLEEMVALYEKWHQPAPATAYRRELEAVRKLVKPAAAEGFPKGTFAASVGKDSWIIRFDAKGKFTISFNNANVVEGTYKVVKDEVVLTDERGPGAETSKRKTGTYKWKLAERKLTFTKIRDEADPRSAVLTSGPWEMQK